jgi:hypothetical protein
MFYLCKCLPLLCFSPVLFLLLIGVGFGLNLIPFWGCLSLVFCAFVYFIGSLKPSKMRSARLFVYTPWSNCLRFDRQINMVPFPLVALLLFVIYSRRLFRLMRSFYSLREVNGRWLVFFSRGVFMCPMCALFSPLMGRFFDHSFSLLSNFRES